MRGIVALLLFALLGVSVYNSWEIRRLQDEIGRLNREVKQQQASQDVMAQALSAVDAARAALARTDMSGARTAFETAKRKMEEAARTAGARTAPTMEWLQKQAADLEHQVSERMRTNR